ncbi:MAG: DUF3365 domain-containing protein [Psychrosphaera sp.]|nr:DUF3365 domain-containing protein [Psychrosphaera sp.]
MSKITKYITLSSLMLLLILSDVAMAQSHSDIANELTTIFRAARKVVSVNQGHINDASIGDKGLSADVVASKTKANFKEATGKALKIDTDAKKAMIRAVKDVMDANQDLINEPDIGLKGFLPAIFARQVANKFTSLMSGKMKIKLTAPKKYVRNRANRPDKWEANIIESLFKKTDYVKGKAFSENTKYKGKDVFRFILPEYYGKSCLSCHGKPKGVLPELPR